MNYRSYFVALNADQREAYARRAGTSSAYIQIHLMATPPRKIPRPELLRALADATEGACSFQDMLAHFYPDAGEPADQGAAA